MKGESADSEPTLRQRDGLSNEPGGESMRDEFEHAGESLNGRSDVITSPPIDLAAVGGQLVRLAKDNDQLRRSRRGTDSGE